MRTSIVVGALMLIITLITYLPHFTVLGAQLLSPIFSAQVFSMSSMTKSDYRDLASLGVNTVELQLFWSQIEPRPGSYNFSLLSTNVKYAEGAGLHYILIFWYGPWDPSWISEYELNSSYEPVNGPMDSYPSWWNLTETRYYIDYVKTTLSKFVGDPDFVGAYVNYGWLDAYWYGGGYSNSSVAMFRKYLISEYGSISALNAAWNTSYSSFNQVIPPSGPGKAGWIDFERFRMWSLNYTLNYIYSSIDPILTDHGKQLFIYWGGFLTDAPYHVDYPDIVFSVAKRYGAIINLDDDTFADLFLTFTDLARAYGVKLMFEWPGGPTASSMLQADKAVFLSSLSHALSGIPCSVGYDYFVYPPSDWYGVTTPYYSSFISTYPAVKFQFVNSSVAALYSFGAETADPAIGAQEDNALKDLIYDYVPFQVITDYEIENGVVNLSRYRYIVNLAGAYGMGLMPAKAQRAIGAWMASGGKLLQISQDGLMYAENESQVSDYVWPYLISSTFSWPGNLNFSGPQVSIGKTRVGGAPTQCLLLKGPAGSSARSQEIPISQSSAYTVNLYVEACKASGAKIVPEFTFTNGSVESAPAESVVTENRTWVWLQFGAPPGARYVRLVLQKLGNASVGFAAVKVYSSRSGEPGLLSWVSYGWAGLPLPIANTTLMVNGKASPALVLNTTMTKAGEIDSQIIEVKPGEPFSFSAYGELGSGSPDARINIRWYFPNGSYVQEQAAYMQWINAGSEVLSVTGTVPAGVSGMMLRLIDDGSGIDYFTDVTLTLTPQPQEVKLAPFAWVDVPFENRLESLQLFPLVGEDHQLALITLYATDFTATDSTTNMLGRPLGQIPSPLKLAINVSALGISAGQEYYVVNMTTMSVLAGPLIPEDGVINVSVKLKVPEEASLVVGSRQALENVSELRLSGPSKVVVGRRVNFTLYQVSPFASVSLANATIIVNGTTCSLGSVYINEAGKYVAYAVWNGERSNEVMFTAGTQAFFIASALWWLPFPAAVAIVVIFVYLSRKKKANPDATSSST